MKDWFPVWPPKDWRSFIALLASVGGGASAFILCWRVMTILSDRDAWRKGLTLTDQIKVILEQLSALKMMAMGALILMALSILGLWFVLGKRSVELSAGDKFKLIAGGGTDDEPEGPPAPISQTTTTTTVMAPAKSVTSTDPAPGTGPAEVTDHKSPPP